MYSRIFLVVCALFNTIDLSASDDVPWNYADLGPEVWSYSFPDCKKQSQSPINIKTVCTTYQNFPQFQFSPAYDMMQDFTIINDGHTVTGKQVNATAFPLILSGGGLMGNYTFVNFHLHWGQNYASGSEHQLNGQKYAGEIHFVHAKANPNADGTQYAVLGMFLQYNKPPANSSDHRRKKRETTMNASGTDAATLAEWQKYVNATDDLTQTSATTVISLELMNLMGRHLDKFYRYSGSLTTPPCSETVTWTVFEAPIVFNTDQLQTFRTYLYEETFREPQPLNGRTVCRNFPDATMTNISDYQCCADDKVTNPGGQSSVSSIYSRSVWLINIQLFMCSAFLMFASFFLI